MKQGLLIEAAVEQAVEDCIHEDILADILSKNRAEVFEMILTEYNEQNHIANEKKISDEDGLEHGLERGLEHGIEALVRTCKSFQASHEDTQKKLMDEMGLTEEEAASAIEKYWR